MGQSTETLTEELQDNPVWADLRRWQKLRAALLIDDKFSVAQWLALRDDAERKDLLTMFADAGLDPEHDPGFWLRAQQFPPSGPFTIWYLCSGKGFGKSWTGANITNYICNHIPGALVLLVGRSSEDCREVMALGPSGILATADPRNMPRYEPAKSRIQWPNGSVAVLRTSQEPRGILGLSVDFIWADEASAFGSTDMETFRTMLGTLRRKSQGNVPQALITGTPKTTPLVEHLISLHEDYLEWVGALSPEDVEVRQSRRNFTPLEQPSILVALSGGSSYDNAPNLTQGYIDRNISIYKNTREEASEVGGVFSRTDPEALVALKWIDDNRVPEPPDDIFLVAIGIDPALSQAGTTGIIPVGLHNNGRDLYVLSDASIRAKDLKSDSGESIGVTGAWVSILDQLYDEIRKAWPMAGIIAVCERNAGWETVNEALAKLNAERGAQRHVVQRNIGGVVKDVVEFRETIKYYTVVATKGKVTRFQPCSLLYERGEVHHAGPASTFAALEQQLLTFRGELSEKSPDRLDALTWAIHYCRFDRQGAGGVPRIY
jgi:phage terminase large subunit-like protein